MVLFDYEVNHFGFDQRCLCLFSQWCLTSQPFILVLFSLCCSVLKITHRDLEVHHFLQTFIKKEFWLVNMIIIKISETFRIQLDCLEMLVSFTPFNPQLGCVVRTTKQLLSPDVIHLCYVNDFKCFKDVLWLVEMFIFQLHPWKKE